ncbi:unnamed protein product [Urochloa decumbens]|uniref:Uncharacterized protein n=1 Tax=Urochloa decumbens TaxID=240449 RepID=A0ABC9EA93_9POAL
MAANKVADVLQETSGDATVAAPSPFEPSVWGDFFVTYTPPPSQRSEEWMRGRADKLKEEVRQMLEAAGKAMSMADAVNLVDTLEHLGIDNHFRAEIDTALRRIRGGELEFGSSIDLHIVSLRFCLLRQHGFCASTDVFDKFRDDTGNFSMDLTNDPRGLLSLYNAAHMAFPGEIALDDAIVFARRHLEAAKGGLRSPMMEQVSRALDIPRPRFMKRLETMHYIMEYEQEEAHDATMLELARLDFNLVRFLHRKELRTVSLWDENKVSILPEYLRILYIKLLDSFNEVENILEPHETYRMASIREMFKLQSRNYLKEARWFNQNYTPSFKEHVDISIMSTGLPMLYIAALTGASQVVTKEAFDWALDMPDMVLACAEVGRFLNDVASYKLGKSKQDAASSLECYMKDHGMTAEDAMVAFATMVEHAWRRVNQACMELDREILPAAQIVVNMTRTLGTMYHRGRDGYTFGRSLKETITFLFLGDIPVY